MQPPREDWVGVIKSVVSAASPQQKSLEYIMTEIVPAPFSTRIKDAGIAIRHSQGYIISTLQGPEIGWRGMPRCVQSQEITKIGRFRSKITKMQV